MATTDRRNVTVSATDTSISGDPSPGLAIKAPCRVATTANITLSGLQTIDGVALTAGDRVLVWQQSDATTNGLYNASASNWTRTLDADGNDQWADGLLVWINSGAAYAHVQFQCSSPDQIVLGTSAINFVPGSAFPVILSSSSVNAFVVGPNGTTNPTLRVNTTGAGSVVLLSPLTAPQLTVNSDNNPTNAGGILVGSRGSSGDDSAILVTRNLAPASGLLNSHAFRDETLATENVTGNQFSGYASFDSAVQVTGTCTTPENHLHGFQARGIFSATGTLNELAGFTAQPNVTGAGSLVVNTYGFFVLNANLTAGGITNQYAFYANTLTGSTNAYFLFQGAPGNPSVLNGKLFVGGLLGVINVEVMNIEYSSVTQQGLLLYDSGNSGTAQPLLFYKGAAQVGSVSCTTTTTAYNTSSDERLKQFTGHYDPTEAARIIRADPVRTFDWIATGESAVGWGAQTSHAISADLATPGDPDMYRKPGDPGFKPWGVDQGKRTPYLWAAMGDVLDRLEAVERKLAA